jgi:hypothetical protein
MTMNSERAASTALAPITIDRVTITGADDSIVPEDLAELSAKYPFVEWGILFSADRFGSPRYPSRDWLKHLSNVAATEPLALSAHLCGRFARAALAADWAWQRAIGDLSWAFGRVQINCANNPEPSIGPMLREWPTTQRVIVQCGDKNREWVEGAAEDGHKLDLLYDNSGGRGVLAARWPRACERVLCGYAGGLGPANVVDNLQCFAEAADGQAFWIDMESKVRSDDNATFDLSKVRRVLSLVGPYFTKIRPGLERS